MRRSSVVVGAVIAGAFLVGVAPAAGAAAIPKFKQPDPYGATFQADPLHDFTKPPSPRHDGILRGWITSYKSGVARYRPIKWKESFTEFVGPPKGDPRVYASAISAKVVYYAAFGCKGTGVTVNAKFLGKKRCTRKELISRLKDGRHPALITVYKGAIVRVQEIYVS